MYTTLAGPPAGYKAGKKEVSDPMKSSTVPASGPLRQPALTFGPNAQLKRFAKRAGTIFALVGGCLIAALALGATTGFWAGALVMAFPAAATAAGAVYALRMASTRVLLEPERLRIVRAGQTAASVPYHTIERLTIRQANGGLLPEVWVKDKPIAVPVGFFEQGDNLLKTLAARAGVDWEDL